MKFPKSAELSNNFDSDSPAFCQHKEIYLWNQQSTTMM